MYHHQATLRLATDWLSVDAGASDYWNWVLYNVLMQLELPVDPVFGHPAHKLQAAQPRTEAAHEQQQPQQQQRWQQKQSTSDHAEADYADYADYAPDLQAHVLHLGAP